MPDTVLIIEDHPDQVDLLARILRLRLHMEVIVAEDGKTGLRLARMHIPDVLLLDLMLPDINGFDVCRQLRLDRTTMLIPVVMVTALNDMQHRVHGFRVGANAYICKPYGVQELFEAIESARNWRARMVPEPREGGTLVQLEDEIALLQSLNDLLMHLARSTPYTTDQLLQLRQAVSEMAHLATEWGKREKVDHPLEIAYKLDSRTFTLTVRGDSRGSCRPHTPCPPRLEADGPIERSISPGTTPQLEDPSLNTTGNEMTESRDGGRRTKGQTGDAINVASDTEPIRPDGRGSRFPILTHALSGVVKPGELEVGKGGVHPGVPPVLPAFLRGADAPVYLSDASAPARQSISAWLRGRFRALFPVSFVPAHMKEQRELRDDGLAGSSPTDDTSRSRTGREATHPGDPEGVGLRGSLENVYRRLKEDGLIEEITYDEGGLVVHLTKIFAVPGEGALPV
jgi:DNA-binding response OmpR family regulator